MSKIRQLREGQCWSRFTLAQKSGVTESFIYKIETGRANPSLKKLEAIARVFGLSAKDLL